MSAQPNPMYYVVSMRKLTILYFGTVGLYAFYWLYRMFLTQQQVNGRWLFPLLRTLLPIFFIFSLFNFVRDEDLKREKAKPWSADHLGWVFVAGWAFNTVFSIWAYNAGAPLALLAVKIVTLMAWFYAIYQIQLAANRLANDAFGNHNQTFNFTNILWLAFGVSMWVSDVVRIYAVHTGRMTWPPMEQTESAPVPVPAQEQDSPFNL